MSVERRIQKLEEEVRWLRRQLAHVPVRVTPGGGGGGKASRCWVEVMRKSELQAVPFDDDLLFAFVSAHDGFTAIRGETAAVYALVRKRGQAMVYPPEDDSGYWVCITHSQEVV
jgi:hypothetical protein